MFNVTSTTRYRNVDPVGFTTDGWFIGGGVETGFTLFDLLPKGFFFRSEYRYASYQNKTLADTGAATLASHQFQAGGTDHYLVDRVQAQLNANIRDCRSELNKKPRERFPGFFDCCTSRRHFIGAARMYSTFSFFALHRLDLCLLIGRFLAERSVDYGRGRMHGRAAGLGRRCGGQQQNVAAAAIIRKRMSVTPFFETKTR